MKKAKKIAKSLKCVDGRFTERPSGSLFLSVLKDNAYNTYDDLEKSDGIYKMHYKDKYAEKYIDLAVDLHRDRVSKYTRMNVYLLLAETFILAYHTEKVLNIEDEKSDLMISFDETISRLDAEFMPGRSFTGFTDLRYDIPERQYEIVSEILAARKESTIVRAEMFFNLADKCINNAFMLGYMIYCERNHCGECAKHDCNCGSKKPL